MREIAHIVIVDDHDLFCQGLASLIQEKPHTRILGTASNAEEALLIIAQAASIAPIALVDIQLKGKDGIALTQEIRQKYPYCKVVAVSMHNNELYLKRMLKAGALGYLLKDCGRDELFQAIDNVRKGRPYFSKEVLATPIEAERLPAQVLTKREREIVQLMARDKTNQEIAETLFLSIRTVETHKHNIMHKTGVKSTAGLMIYCIKHDYITLPL